VPNLFIYNKKVERSWG